MRILITYGSKRGGTEGLAQMLGDFLRDEHFEVDVRPPVAVDDLSSYDVAIVGGALYANRWHKAARRFVKRHKAELSQRPTYLFSSGPLDDKANVTDVAAVPGVSSLMKAINARGHVTFGGRLLPDAKGFPASAMAKSHSGDWRDSERVRAWAKTIAAQLDAGRR
jgi:menaquinone-dependent protoporphyrinogen oxidase